MDGEVTGPYPLAGRKEEREEESHHPTNSTNKRDSTAARMSTT